MDLSNTIRKALATISTISLLAVQVPFVSAQTFNDVATDSWYFDYVEQLVDQGVVDAADNFRPNSALNRAELVKMAVTAVDGLAGYQAPATPTFDDVTVDAWYYDYVEAAVQLDIVSGYTDASGALTGKFGPGDTVNRAAATKILVNAFSVPTMTSPAAPFSDVAAGAWFYDYVTTAYNQSIVDGYADGRFGPADPVTRAQVAKLVVNSQHPKARGGETPVTPTTPTTPETPTTPTTPTTPQGEGALEVSLNDKSAPSSTVPVSASNVGLATFDFTAADSDVVLSNVKVTRGGVGKASDWSALYLYQGDKRITTGRTINSDTNTATFPVSVTVAAGSTVSLRLVGDVATSTGASNQHYFYIASAADVTSNGKSTAGDFPVAGNTFTMGGAATVVNSLTISAGSTPSQPNVGATNAEIAALQLRAGATNDIALHSVTLSQEGSLSSSKLSNLRLLRGTDEVATAAGFEGDRVTFVLATPYVIPKGQTKSFYVRADINGGRTTDSIDLYIDEATDVVAIDQQYGYGAVINKDAFASGSTTTAITLQGGKVTITDNGPAATQIAQNVTNVKLLDYSITTDRDLTVRDMQLVMTITTSTGAIPDVAASGTAAVTAAASTAAALVVTDVVAASIAVGDMLTVVATSGTTYYCAVTVETNDAGANTTLSTGCPAVAVASGNAISYGLNPYTYMKNVRIVDLDSGSTLQGPLTYMSDGTKSPTATPTVDTTYLKVLSEDYELVAGETRHLSVQADIDQNMPANYLVKVGIDYAPATGSNYVKDFSANEFVTQADIVGHALTGKNMTVTSNTLTVALAATPTSQTFVKGEDGVSAIGVSFKAGDAGAINVKKIILRAYGDNDVNFDASVGELAANRFISSITLYDGNNVVAGPIGLTLVDGTSPAGYTTGADYYKATFDNLSLAVPKGGTKTLTAKVKLLNTETGTNYIALDMAPASDITAEDKDANTITPSIASGTNLNTTTSPSRVVTIVESGTLTGYSEGNPSASVVIAGSNEVLVSKYRFHALREGFRVNKLTVINDTTSVFDDDTDTGAVTNVTVKYTDADGVQQTAMGSLSGGNVTLSALGIYVPKDGDANVEIYASVSTRSGFGEALSGKTFRLGIQDTSNNSSLFEAVGAASSTTSNSETGANATVINNGSAVNTYIVRTTKPSFAKVTSSNTLINSENTLYAFTVTADAGGSVSFGRLVFDVTTSSTTITDVNTFKLLKGSENMDSTKINISATGSTTTVADVTGSTGLATANSASNALVESETYKVIVSFNQEESVTAGQSQTFYLKAAVAAATTNNSITTKIAQGDEGAPVSGLTTNNGNANTGRVFATAADTGLFVTTDTNFARSVGTARNVIWSDKSADSHAYPTVDTATDAVTTATGSYDWTNGYLLKLTEVNAQTLTY